MAASNVVIVESPAKAKTINKYLGSDYRVLASFGHVRDLEGKDGAVLPDEDFAMRWEVDPKAKKRIDDIADALKGARKLILATDPDREGEAISWHLAEVLNKRKLPKDIATERVVFNEITKTAVTAAMKAPRQIDRDLVDAYLARRALDYLVGFTLSPVLWRKLPGAKSAGRVQSVALRLICEREAEIEAFHSEEYWTVEGRFTSANGDAFTARLIRFDGRKLDKFSLKTEADAMAAVQAARAARWSVGEIERKTKTQNPAPPFTTSTLQQEASRKLRFGASRTMQLAQKLYEGIDLGGETVGLITYMRTDSISLSQDAIGGLRDLIGDRFGADYLPEKPRLYKTKAKNAQEAHEAIRPTDVSRSPEQMRAVLDDDLYRLYELIWKRTVACQMASALIDQAGVDIQSVEGAHAFRATGSVIRFDGFLKLYFETRDDPTDEDGEEGDRRLPHLVPGEAATLNEPVPEQHFTQPPPRYSEASLVKKMEELGIGRPSTYASILKVLQDREYVRLDARRFIPEDRGRLVTAFLETFFRRYVEYDFTAAMENELDEVSGGRADWKSVLRRFWTAFHGATEEAKTLSGQDVRQRIDEALGPHFFPPDAAGSDEHARRCTACGTGRLSLNFGRYGAFIACSNYPECRYTRPLEVRAGGAEGEGGDEADAGEFPRILGKDPETGQEVSLRKGPYGIYVQLGEGTKGAKGAKPKRASLLKGMEPATLTLEQALRLLALPRDIGPHPDSGDMIQAGVGRYGPYLKIGPRYVNLTAEDNVLEIGINRAVEVLAQAADKTGGRGRGGAGGGGRALGEHPGDGKPVTVGAGRYGPYVKHGTVYATIPKDIDPASVTMAEAVELLAAKRAKSGDAAPTRKATAKPKAAGKAKSASKAKPRAARKA